MRIALADIRAQHGVVNKDTVAGGYGSRMTPFSRSTAFYCHFKNKFHSLPSIQLAYIASILAQRQHEVVATEGELIDCDLAIVLSSLVDYRNEVSWADQVRKRGAKVGFVGLAASKLPELFSDHADFVIQGEPEKVALEIAEGRVPSGVYRSDPIMDLDTLPFPRWDLLRSTEARRIRMMAKRPVGGGVTVLASRGCPEFCTYCPHRILAGYRARSVENILAELEVLCSRYFKPHIVFRDPLFTEQRDRCLELCEGIARRGLRLQFECETRLDHLDFELLDAMRGAGLRLVTFGVESLSNETLKQVGRRPTPDVHQRSMVEACYKRGIRTAAYYVFGFLQDDWKSISGTIEYSISLGSTFAQFKLLTPYPATPLWKQMQPLVLEKDWEKFDGYTPTFQHPNLTAKELRFLLGAAYARFYCRPSWLANFLKIERGPLRGCVERLDLKAFEAHFRKELHLMSRGVTW